MKPTSDFSPFLLFSFRESWAEMQRYFFNMSIKKKDPNIPLLLNVTQRKSSQGFILVILYSFPFTYVLMSLFNRPFDQQTLSGTHRVWV